MERPTGSDLFTDKSEGIDAVLSSVKYLSHDSRNGSLCSLILLERRMLDDSMFFSFEEWLD